MKKLLFLVAVSTLGLGFSGCGEEPVPDYPSYAVQIQPLLVARCARCHGTAVAGVTDPDPDSPPLPGKTKEKPLTSGFETFAGAKAAGPLIKVSLDIMPPAPSPALTDREKELLTRWIANPLP
jgi:hypothetical protein